MTEVQDSTNRAAKWMRQIALIWACWWTFYIVAGVVLLDSLVSFNATILFQDAPPLREMTPLGPWFCVMVPLLVLIPWVSVAIARRWGAVGGVILVLEGLLVFIPLPVIFPPHYSPHMDRAYSPLTSQNLLCTPPIALPTLLVGFLFLGSWWRSRRSGIAQNSA